MAFQSAFLKSAVAQLTQKPCWGRGQLQKDEVRLMVWQLLHALKYLHANNVWHRDLKSSNVMLTRAHGHRVVKVPLLLRLSAVIVMTGECAL